MDLLHWRFPRAQWPPWFIYGRTTRKQERESCLKIYKWVFPSPNPKPRTLCSHFNKCARIYTLSFLNIHRTLLVHLSWNLQICNSASKVLSVDQDLFECGSRKSDKIMSQDCVNGSWDECVCRMINKKKIQHFTCRIQMTFHNRCKYKEYICK